MHFLTAISLFLTRSVSFSVSVDVCRQHICHSITSAHFTKLDFYLFICHTFDACVLDSFRNRRIPVQCSSNDTSRCVRVTRFQNERLQNWMDTESMCTFITHLLFRFELKIMSQDEKERANKIPTWEQADSIPRDLNVYDEKMCVCVCVRRVER